MTDHHKNLQKAIELSDFSVDHGSSPFGCVIVDAAGKVIGEGYNMLFWTMIRQRMERWWQFVMPARILAVLT